MAMSPSRTDIWLQVPETAPLSSRTGLGLYDYEGNREYQRSSIASALGSGNELAFLEPETWDTTGFEQDGVQSREPEDLAACWPLEPSEAVEREPSEFTKESIEYSLSTQAFEFLAEEESSMFGPSISYITNELADVQSKGWLRHGLLKIYHDSMEGALGCWLVSRNCPYQIIELETNDAWGPSWSN